MNTPLGLQHLLILVMLLVLNVKANPLHFSLKYPFRRANNNNNNEQSSITSQRTGVLVKNGVQTSCELALIDNKAAFVAANCVTNTSGKLDTSSAYTVSYADSTVQSSKAVSASITSSSITLHPDYSVDTLANNIAIIQFNPSATVSWQNPIAVNYDTWSDTVLSRRRLVSVSSANWASLLSESLSESTGDCAGNSGLYSTNTNDFVCSFQRSAPLMSSQCNLPYGSVYGVQNSNAAVAGLYSYSVINGDQFCGSSSVVSYYLMLSDYVAFAKDTIGRDVSLSFDQGFTVNNVITYSMKQESFSSPSGTSVLTGNLFGSTGNNNWVFAKQVSSQTTQNDSNSSNINSSNKNNSSGGSNSNSNQNNSNGDSSASSISAAAAGGLITDAGNLSVTGDSSIVQSNGNSFIEGDSDYSDSDSDSASNTVSGGNINSTGKDAKNGLSGGDIAALVICLLIGVVLIAAALFFGSRWYRQYKLRRRWAPDTVQNIVETQAVNNELGNRISASFDLPSYRQHRQTMFVAAGPSSPQ